MHLLSWGEFAAALAVYAEHGLPVWLIVAPFPVLIGLAVFAFVRLRVRRGLLTLFWTALLFIIVSRLDGLYVALA